MVIKTSKAYKLIFLILLLVLVLSLTACQEVQQEDGPKYSVNDDESNQINKDRTEKVEAIDKVTSSITNLKTRLNSQDVGEGGYYMGFDFHINTASNSNFVLKLQAHLFTWPYMNEYGVIREDDLKKHNELIKKSTILLEWYDGITNSMLIGFYFDGIKANPNDPGNILYLNLQGEKRWFPDFGDSVLFQQMIRLITNFSLDDVLAAAGIGEDGGVSAIESLLMLAITNNYKVVLNHNEETNKDVTSVLFNSISLDVIENAVTGFLQNLFGPFENKVDPFTNKYLGFKFSTLGRTTIRSLNTDLQFFIEPDTDGVQDILTSAYANMLGTAEVDNQIIPFTSEIRIYYGAAPPKPIELDKEFYKFYDYGKYEFTGDLYLPTMNLQLDALIRTKVNEYDNTINHVFSEFRDIANGDLIIGAYYKNELAYIDIEGLQHLYGGVKIEDIGFPKVYIEGWNLADMLASFFDMVDNTIISIVDRLLDPQQGQENDMLQVILNKMASTEKVPGDPLSRNTEMIRIDHELVKDVLREGGYGTYTTRDIINIINAQLPITLDELATILGITSAEILLEKTWIKFTLDVDTNQITIQIYSDIGIMDENEPSKMLMQLDLTPVKIGEDMAIAEINFDDFNELLPVYTYSAEMGGQFLFSNAEQVDLSELLSAFMDDISGLNTPYILPMETKLDFTLVYDQYIKAQFLQRVPGGERDGRWTEASRNAFILNVFIKGATPEDNVTLFNIYANDVSFKSDAPVEELGYIWVDLVCLRSDPNIQNIPKFKIREDYWLQSMNRYLNASEAGDEVGNMLNPDISLSITTIISALVEDSFVVFQPDQIEITTSNETVQNIFGVKSLIGNIHAQIGLVQRVFGVDEIEDEFAHYTVEEFEDIVSYSPYTTKLHETIDVTFSFNQGGRIWDEVVPLKFLYDEETIKIPLSGQSVYHPAIYGPIFITEYDKINRFMGAERSYKITFTADADYLKAISSLANKDWYDPEEDRIITEEEIDAYSQLELAYFNSIRHRLLPYYRLEPMLPKPTEMAVLVGEDERELKYNTDIRIDWDTITTAGGEFFTEAVIAEGMMGETRFPLYIIVTNRVINTSNQNPSKVIVSAHADSPELTEAPVVNTITIDPYDYLWAKAIYFRDNYQTPSTSDEEVIAAARRALSIEFIKHYIKSYNISIRFVDFDPDVTDYRDTPIYNDHEQEYDNRLEWYFDKYLPDEYYKETDIVLSGGSTYLHADFFGQIVALQVNIASRTIRAVNFGEVEDNVYTVDMLDRDTFEIPLFPLIIFEERDSSDRYITKRFYESEDFNVPMRWSNPVVNQPDIHGTDTPFAGTESNETSSYIDLYRALGVGEWIFKDFSPIVVIRVECPSKEIAELDIDPVIGYDNLENWNGDNTTEIHPSNILVGDYENPNNYAPVGFYHVDPFNPSTARIPDTVTIRFKGRLEGDPTYTKTYYGIEWDESTGLIEKIDGYYYLTVNSENESYLKITALVGEEDIGQIEIVLCVKILTSNYSHITFFEDADNQIEMTDISEIYLGNYRYSVDTYQGFKLPYSFSALFGEQDERYYLTNWRGYNGIDYVVDLKDIKFEAGSIIYLRTTLPGANGNELNVDLEVIVLDITLEDIIFTNIPMIKNEIGQLVVLPITLRLSSSGEDLTIGGTEGIKLNEEGKIENLYFGRGFYQNSLYEFSGVNVPYINGVQDEMGNYIQDPVEPVTLYPYEFLQMLFLNTCLVFDYEQNEKLVRDYEIYNLAGILNVKDIIQRDGDSGSFGYGNGKYVVRLGQGQGAKDLEIRIKFVAGLYPISDKLYPAQENEVNFLLDLYDESGNALWSENGFVFGDIISASVTTSVQVAGESYGRLRTYDYGPEFGIDAVRLDQWYVEYSNIGEIATGSYITSIPTSILYNRAITSTMQLRIAYLTEQGFKISRNLQINQVEFGEEYNSVAAYGDLFEIQNGLILIEDLYQFYPLNLYLSGNDYLPKTINRQTEYYDITLSNIRWTIASSWRSFLETSNFEGDVAPRLFATAKILGWYETVPNQYGVPERVYHDQETIQLYIKVDSARAMGLPLESSHGLKTSFEDITVNYGNQTGEERIAELFGVSLVTGEEFSYREFVIFVDAYKNSNYQGIFVPPADLRISYMTGIQHSFNNLSYTYRGVPISEIRYDINGIIYQSDSGGNYIMSGSQKIYLMRGDNRYNITLRLDLGAEQVIAIKIHFYDKTATAVRPVVDYSDAEVRNHIANELSDLMDRLMVDLQYNINITKLIYEITSVITKNNLIKEGIDKEFIFNELKKLDLDQLTEERVRLLLSYKIPELYENPGIGEDDKIYHNYATEIIIKVYEEMLDENTMLVFSLLSDYLNEENGIVLTDIQTAVNDFVDEVYNESARLIINNQIIDFAEPRILLEIQSMPTKQRLYVIKLKNQIEAQLNTQSIISRINNIMSTDLAVVADAMIIIINEEFERMVQQAIAESNDSEELKNAVTALILQRKDDMTGSFVTLCNTLANIYLNNISGNMRDLIEEYFDTFFYMNQPGYNTAILDTIILALKQQIENTSSNLIIEMRASMAAGLSVNTGGRLSRAVNLSIAAAVNNVILEGKIMDAIRMARNLNVYNSENGQYAIDPYSDYIYVPTRTEIIFSDINGGDSHIVNISWDKPAYWSTPRNPNAGVTYRGNEGDIRDAKDQAWTTLFNELEIIDQDIELEFSFEQELLYSIMRRIIEDIYEDILNSRNPSLAMMADGWLDLLEEPGNETYLSLIESRVLIRNPGVEGYEKHALCFQMWANIEAWEDLKVETVFDDPETPDNEQAVWQKTSSAFSHIELAILRDEFKATLYSEGIAPQNLSLIVLVHDRRLQENTWNLYNEIDGTDCNKVDPIYHIDDPFAGKVSDFPSLINLDEGIVIGSNLVSFSDLLVNWEYTDEAITYAGTVVINENTGKMGIMITGYIKNSRVGQQVRLRLIVNSWQYNDTSGSGIRQYNGSGDINDENNYTIMNPISFIFSKLVDYAAQDQYQVMIKETKYMNNINELTGEIIEEWTEIQYRNIFFYPEDSRLVQDSIKDDEMSEIKARRNYLLYWDQEAKDNAFNSGATVLGSFSLGNAHKNRLTRANSAYYQFEESYINKVNVTGYSVESIKEWLLYTGRATTEPQAEAMAQEQVAQLYGTTGVSLLVINPLNPVLPVTVNAKGILNQISNTDLGKVRVFWNKTYSRAVLDMTDYVKYMHPTLTNLEAQQSAMELLMNTSRTKVQEQELINNIIEWLKYTWQIENQQQFSDRESENWDIYYNSSNISPSVKSKMDNIMETLLLDNGNRTSNAQKSEGWYRMYEFLVLLDSIAIMSTNEKVQAWNNLAQNEDLEAMRARIESSSVSIDENQSKALAYDVYVKWQKWLALKQKYSQLFLTNLINETDNLYSKVVFENPGLTQYEYYGMCWDVFAGYFEGQDKYELDILMAQAQSEYPPGSLIVVLNAAAWDKWIRVSAFKNWMTRQAKDMLLIDEIYDVQTSPHYMDGGIDGTKTVTLLLQLTEGGYIYTQTFKIRLVFLDLSPLAYYSDSAGNNRVFNISQTAPPSELTIAVKAEYKNTDYAGRINPYDTTQPIVFDMMDYFVKETFVGEIVNKYISGDAQNVKLIRVTNIVWNIPSGSVSGQTVYSSSFTIGNKSYQSNMLKMVLE